MRFKISQRILNGSLLTWVVIDTQRNNKVVSKGSWTSCSNACRELNDNLPKLTQKEIDSDGSHRKGFWYVLGQLKSAVFPSTQQIVE